MNDSCEEKVIQTSSRWMQRPTADHHQKLSSTISLISMEGFHFLRVSDGVAKTLLSQRTQEPSLSHLCARSATDKQMRKHNSNTSYAAATAQQTLQDCMHSWAGCKKKVLLSAWLTYANKQ